MPKKINLDFGLLPHQVELVESKHKYTGLVSGVGGGKALSLDTPIPTADGWTTMADICVGDIVFDEQGKICNVTFVSDIMEGHKCYKVSFSDGSSITADAEHLWSVYSYNTRKQLSKGRHKEPDILTTEQIAETIKYRHMHNYSIPTTFPLRTEMQDLPIDPYVLGAWLGDGNSNCGNITNIDQPILDEIERRGYSVKQIPSNPISYVVGSQEQKRDAITGRMLPNGSLTSILREHGLTYNKHIPMPYLRASIDQRLDLLKGLMDTDGYAASDGGVVFYSTNQRLAKDVHELVLTLGIKATLNRKKATLYGKDCGDCYYVLFTPYIPVFHLSRKLERQKKPGKQADRQRQRYITHIEPCASVPVRCIRVDSESHLYLASENFIATHNTYSGAVKATVTGIRTPGLGMIVSPTYGMLEDSTLRMFKRIAGEAIGSYNKSAKQGTFVNGHEFICRSADDPEHLRGPNIAWIWIDEAQLVSEEAWYVMEGRLREGVRQAWATFTPNGKLHWTYTVFGKNDASHKMIEARTKDNIYLPEDYITILYESYTGNRLLQELEGKFVDPEGALFNRSWFRPISPEQLPKGLQWVRSWDLALTEEDAGDSKRMIKADRTATIKAAVDQFGNIYLDAGDAWRMEWPDTRRMMIKMAKEERIPIVIEAVAFQKAAVQEMLREPELMGVEIQSYVPGQEGTGVIRSISQSAYAERNPRRDKDKSKVDRARVWQARAANRQVYYVESKWAIPDANGKSKVDDCFSEVCDFRADMSHRHDDWVDAISIAMKHLRMPVLYQALRHAGKPSGLAFDKAYSSKLLTPSNIVVI